MNYSIKNLVEKKEPLPNNYYWSTDMKTIEGPKPLGDAIRAVRSVLGNGELIQSTFTTFDLKSGNSLKMIINNGRKGSKEFWIGKNLKPEELSKPVDSWGRIKK